jgi:hypothetical protein
MLLVVETTSVKGGRQVEVGIVPVCEQTETSVGLAVSADLDLRLNLRLTMPGSSGWLTAWETLGYSVSILAAGIVDR